MRNWMLAITVGWGALAGAAGEMHSWFGVGGAFLGVVVFSYLTSAVIDREKQDVREAAREAYRQRVEQMKW